MHLLVTLNNLSPLKMTNIAQKEWQVPKLAHEKGAILLAV